MFKELKSYKEYLLQHPFHKKLGLDDIDKDDSLESKATWDPYYAVNPSLDEAFPAEMDDLIRLHYLITSRKVTTILEFGVGKSSIVFDDALEYNKTKYNEYVSKNLRRSNPFECHSVDTNQQWIDVAKNTQKTSNITYYYSPCRMSTFNDRICTYFEEIPNICPDFIYLDGPDQYSIKGDIRGTSTNHPDRLPMVADILAMEHFLLPGTMIVVDGRTANARFMKTNFQRDWSYWYFEEYDQHFFELTEEPLGVYNKNQIDFCLK